MTKQYGSFFFSRKNLTSLLHITPLCIALLLSTLSLFFAKTLIISGLPPALIYSGNIFGMLAVISILYTYACIYSHNTMPATDYHPTVVTLALAILFLESIVALNTYSIGNMLAMHLLSTLSSAAMLQLITSGMLIAALTLTTAHLTSYLINSVRKKNIELLDEVTLLKEVKNIASESLGALLINVDQHNKNSEKYRQELIKNNSEHEQHCQTLSDAALFLQQVTTHEKVIDETVEIEQIRLAAEYEEALSPIQKTQAGG